MKVRIFPIALGKVILHASSSPDTEVAGLLIGRESHRVLEVWDVETGPQEGRRGYVYLSEEFMASVAERLHSSNSGLYIVGWYHSHPGFGVFLSSVDVRTQLNYQAMYPKAVALVIDPIPYVKTGKISDIAFKFYQVDGTMGVVELPVLIGVGKTKLLESTISGLRGYDDLSRFGDIPQAIIDKARRSIGTIGKRLLRLEEE